MTIYSPLNKIKSPSLNMGKKNTPLKGVHIVGTHKIKQQVPLPRKKNHWEYFSMPTNQLYYSDLYITLASSQLLIARVAWHLEC